MSVKLMSLVWDTDLPHAQKSIMLCLADFANDEGKSIYPSQATIAKKTSLSVRTVRDALRALEGDEKKGDGLIDRVGTTEYQTAEYAINVKNLKSRAKKAADTPAADAAPPRQQMPPPPATFAGPPGDVCRTPPAAAADNPLVKPLVNPSVKPPVEPGARGAKNYHACSEIYEEITNLVPDVIRLERITDLIESIQRHSRYPREKLVEYLKEYYALWCSSKTADGRPYNRTRPDWLEWAATGYKPAKGVSSDDGKQDFYNQLDF